MIRHVPVAASESRRASSLIPRAESVLPTRSLPVTRLDDATVRMCRQSRCHAGHAADAGRVSRVTVTVIGVSVYEPGSVT